MSQVIFLDQQDENKMLQSTTFVQKWVCHNEIHTSKRKKGKQEIINASPLLFTKNWAQEN